MPGGYFSFGSYIFFRMGNDCYFWSSTERDEISALSGYLSFDSAYFYISGELKNNYYSVRLVKD